MRSGDMQESWPESNDFSVMCFIIYQRSNMSAIKFRNFLETKFRNP